MSKKTVYDKIDEDPLFDHDYFVHIDIVEGGNTSTKLGKMIHDYMIESNCLDPRRADHDYVREENRKGFDTCTTKNGEDRSKSFYELWKVPQFTWSSKNLRLLIESLPIDDYGIVFIRVCRMVGEGHDNSYFSNDKKLQEKIIEKLEEWLEKKEGSSQDDTDESD
jgi:hypothetical protein